MATDDRITIDVGDLLAIQVECLECGTAVSYPPSKWDPQAIIRCPTCMTYWWQGDTGPRWVWDNLVKGLMGLRDLKKEEEPFRLRFQVRRPDQVKRDA